MKDKAFLTFDDYGGYDMMSSAYHVYLYGEKENKLICSFDTSDFEGGLSHEKNEEAHMYAQLFVDAINKGVKE